MEQSYWYAGWGWFFWLGIWLLLISSFGSWGYTYRVHRKYSDRPNKGALDILNERYARGEIDQAEFKRIRNDITTNHRDSESDSRQYKLTPRTSQS